MKKRNRHTTAIHALVSFISVFFASTIYCCGQIDFEKYEPISTLKVIETKLQKAKFPFIDVHSHIWDMNRSDLSSVIKEMNSMNMTVLVNLSGRSGTFLDSCIKNVNSHYPGRFIVFANIDFRGIGKKSWTKQTVDQLQKDFEAGARGLKIYESLGYSIKDNNGNRVCVDDPRLDPIWKRCGELGIPVLIHSAAPKSFWDPLDNQNERLLELVKHPERKRSSEHPAPWAQVINEQHRMFKKHPETKFIAAHLGWFGGNLDTLGIILDNIPNMYTEFGAVIAELGRQPRRSKVFFEKYQDRILFGKDSWIPGEYTTYFRVLETEDEYFPYHKKYHAFWRMYGIGLTDEILKKIYYKNALRIIPGIDPALFEK